MIFIYDNLPNQGIGDGRTKTAETLDKKTALDETNKKKQGRGRGRPASGTGRVSKSNEHSHAIVASTVQIPNGAPDLFSKVDNYLPFVSYIVRKYSSPWNCL